MNHSRCAVANSFFRKLSVITSCQKIGLMFSTHGYIRTMWNSRQNKTNCYLENNTLYYMQLCRKKRKKKKYLIILGPYTWGTNTILPPVHTAAITTKKAILFKYGKIEIRAKFPVGDWLFPCNYI